MAHELGDRYEEVLGGHHRLLRKSWLAHGGVEVNTEGDSFFVAFADPGQAVRAAVAAQRAVGAHEWRDGRELRVRIGVHTGSPRVRGNDYWGIDVNYAARLCAAAHGGQVLLSESTGSLVDLEVEDLGAVKDFPSARRIFRDSSRFGGESGGRRTASARDAGSQRPGRTGLQRVVGREDVAPAAPEASSVVPPEQGLSRSSALRVGSCACGGAGWLREVVARWPWMAGGMA